MRIAPFLTNVGVDTFVSTIRIKPKIAFLSVKAFRASGKVPELSFSMTLYYSVTIDGVDFNKYFRHGVGCHTNVHYGWQEKWLGESLPV